MNSISPRSMVRLSLVTLALIAAPVAAAAQERPAPVAEFAAGSLLFADDGVVAEGFAGGTARVYLTPRISVGPEVAFIQGTNHSHLMLTGNVTFESALPGKRQIPADYAVRGRGRRTVSNPRAVSEPRALHLLRRRIHRGRRRPRPHRRHVVVGAEARIGWELHLRLNGLIGVSFGGR